MADKHVRSRSGRTAEELAARFAERAKANPELARRVQENWGAGDWKAARRIIEDDDADDGDQDPVPS